MKKVKNIWFAQTQKEREEVGGHYTTGLVLELEDGTWLTHHSTDPVMPFEVYKVADSSADTSPSHLT